MFGDNRIFSEESKLLPEGKQVELPEAQSTQQVVEAQTNGVEKSELSEVCKITETTSEQIANKNSGWQINRL